MSGTPAAKRTLGMALALGLMVAPAQGAAQQLPEGTTAGGGLTFETFHFSDEDAPALSSVSLLSVPVALRVHPFGPVRLEVSGGFARGQMERPDGSTTTISGLVDTQVRLGVDRVLDDRLALSVIAILPTGEDTFSGEEAVLAGIVAADLLPFQFSSWGSGGGVGATGSFVHPVDFGNVMLSGTFLVPGEFDAVEGSVSRYQAGPVFQIGAGVDRNVGSASRLSVRASVQRFGDDELEDQTLFRSGSRLQLLTSYAFPVGSAGSGIAYGGYLHRTEGTSLAASAEDRPSQGLLYAGVGLRRSWGESVLVPSLEARLVRRESGEDQGVLAGVGLAVERTAGAVRIIPSATVRFGRLEVREDVSSSIVGAEIGLSIRRSVRGGGP